ncbi:MAG TPA: RNA polymerase sigma factor [Thermomicrobiales bacterium]|nr:RNA polymerase sigma factor [Thermomicrobiales bacterium]
MMLSTTTHDSDRATVPRIAFATLVERHGADLHRYAWSLTRNPEDADDVYQETLLKAYKAWRRLPADANHRAWLFRIASNTWISDRRKNGRVHQMADDAPELPDRGPDTVTQVAATDTLERVTHAIEALPPKQRAALVLRKYHDMSYDEIGEVLDSSGEAVRANVYEALRKLRGQFAAALAD